MRWPWQRRSRAGRMVFIGGAPWERGARATSGRVAATTELRGPEQPDGEMAAWGFVSDPDPDANESPQPGDSRDPVAPVPGVRLGFADGSVLMLPDADPTAAALRRAAARLTARVDPPE